METQRLHRLTKPHRKPVAVDDDLPSVNSHSEDEDDWSSDIGAGSSGTSAHGSDEELPSDWEASTSNQSDSDAEMSYEAIPRYHEEQRGSLEEKQIRRLPIKLPDGRIQPSTEKIVSQAKADTSDEENLEENRRVSATEPGFKVEDVSTGARFGRPAVVDVVSNKSRKARIEGAKDQIASICQDIVSDPENSVSFPPMTSPLSS